MVLSRLYVLLYAISVLGGPLLRIFPNSEKVFEDLIKERLSEENLIVEEPGIFYLDDEESNGRDEWIASY
jgi:hypothetical protein